MRKAQTENGYAKLANELAREVARRAFTARQFSILFLVIPETYGMKGRQFAPLTPSYVAEQTGIDVSNVRKALVGLMADRILITGPDGWVGINPRLDEWATDSRQVKSTSAMSSQIDPTEKVKSTRSERSNQPEKKVKSTRDTTLKPSGNAASQNPKETIKETMKESMHAKPAFSEEELAALGQVVQGLAVGPYEVPLRLRRFLEEKIAKGRLGESVLDAFDALEHPVKVAWCVRSMEIAREKARDRGLWLSFAAGVIGRAIESGEDLAPQKQNVVEFKKPEPVNPHADKPWAPLNDPKNFGYRWTDEGDQVRYLVERLIRMHPRPGVYDDLNQTYRNHGYEAFMALAWDYWKKHSEASNG